MSEQAGREMDARVAEKVMGWERVEFLRDMLPGTFFIHDDRGVVAVIDDKFSEFTPSTSIAAAWEIVTKMSPDWGIDMCNWGTEWNVSFHERNNSANYHYVVHPSLPMAIALAALKAVGAEGEGL